MKERELNFSHNHDATLLVMKEDKIKATTKSIKDLYFVLQELSGRINNNTLEKGFSETLLSLVESHSVDILKAFDFDSVLRRGKENRHSEIRSLNIQNVELRKQLGDKVSAEDVREKMKNFHDVLRDWWKKEGLGFVQDVTFQGYNCQAKLSGSMTMHYEKTQPEYLRNKGYVVREVEKNSFELDACDSNIIVLQNEITKRFPSAKIWDMEIVNWHGLTIRSVTFYIKNFEDFEERTSCAQRQESVNSPAEYGSHNKAMVQAQSSQHHS